MGEGDSAAKNEKVEHIKAAVREHPDRPITVACNAGDVYAYQDLDMLQKLGLEFGDVLEARDLFRLIFQKIPTTQDLCKRDGSPVPQSGGTTAAKATWPKATRTTRRAAES